MLVVLCFLLTGNAAFAEFNSSSSAKNRKIFDRNTTVLRVLVGNLKNYAYTLDVNTGNSSTMTVRFRKVNNFVDLNEKVHLLVEHCTDGSYSFDETDYLLWGSNTVCEDRSIGNWSISTNPCVNTYLGKVCENIFLNEAKPKDCKYGGGLGYPYYICAERRDNCVYASGATDIWFLWWKWHYPLNEFAVFCWNFEKEFVTPTDKRSSLRNIRLHKRSYLPTHFKIINV